MPPASTSTLFHPKKKNGVVQQRDSSPTKKPIRPLPARARPPPQPAESNDAVVPPLPDGPYQEFKLMSSALNGWKYDVMKFDSRRQVDITTWRAPVRLNRKELRRGNDDVEEAAPQAVGPMLGPDGKPVIGLDGKMVMVDASGKPIRNTPSAGPGGGGGGAAGAKGKGPGRKFQKKTKQVYLVPEATRQMRREERHPWVLEDSAGQETWVGAMEEVSKSGTYAMFMPSTAEVFKFVPAHRWYKFQKKPTYRIPSLEEAESLMARIQKNKDPERWLLHNRKGQAPSAATAALFKAEADGRGASDALNGGPSRGPGGRRLRAVDSGANDLFGDDDEEGGGSNRNLGGEGDLDELDFEEAPADDEDKMDDNDDDDEAKELEERLKREYKAANKTREGNVDESDEEEIDLHRTKSGNAMRKLIRNLERNEAYENDSDEDKNPYASSEEEEEEEPPLTQDGPAIQPQDQKQALAAGHEVKPSADPATAANGTTTQPGSRATSPAAPNLSGHSMVAKRATSPKAPRPKPQNGSGGSRATSPLAGGSGSRATSPAGSRASSPAAQKAPMQNKRKADEANGASSPPPTGGMPKKKKIRPAQPGAVVDGPLDAKKMLDYLRATPNATTRMCIQHFGAYLKDPEMKTTFAEIVKEVAVLKDGVLVIRPAFL